MGNKKPDHFNNLKLPATSPSAILIYGTFGGVGARYFGSTESWFLSIMNNIMP